MTRSRASTRSLLAWLVLLPLGLLATPSLIHAQCASFQRGDANADGSLDIADGIATLGYLFLGSFALDCLDAADTDDSGTLDIADAVGSFQYLFLGGPPPPLPGPDHCGADPTFSALGCEFHGPCGPHTRLIDRSGFSKFRYTQTPALGFCPEVDEVFEATITRGELGLVLALSILREDDPDSPERCAWSEEHHVVGVGCVHPVVSEPRILSEDEAELVRTVFAALEELEGPDPICNCVAIDPCRIRIFAWDGHELSDFPCAQLRAARVESLLDLLETLARAAGG
jgi:hypothetical protein